jgi:ankyrin repeat protein
MSLSHGPRLGDIEGTIWHAAGKGDLVELKALLASSPGLLNARDEFNMTPLMWAIWEGRLPSLRLLLSQPGIDTNAGDCFNRTAVYWAAVSRYYVI